MADAGVLYKKRGIGMCVAAGAREKISARRRDVFLNQSIGELLAEAKTLGIPTDELIRVIEDKAKNESKNENNLNEEENGNENQEGTKRHD